jgi:hypothetical protein
MARLAALAVSDRVQQPAARHQPHVEQEDAENAAEHALEHRLDRLEPGGSADQPDDEAANEEHDRSVEKNLVPQAAGRAHLVGGTAPGEEETGDDRGRFHQRKHRNHVARWRERLTGKYLDCRDEGDDADRAVMGRDGGGIDPA